MFHLLDPSSVQIQNIVLVHSVSAHIMGSHTVYKIMGLTMYQYYGIP